MVGRGSESSNSRTGTSTVESKDYLNLSPLPGYQPGGKLEEEREMNKSNLYRKLHVSATVNTRFSAVFTYVCMHIHTHTQAGTASTVVSFPPHSTNILLVTLSCGDKTARITSDSCS